MTRRHLLQSAPALLSAATRKARGFALIGDRPHNSDYLGTGLRQTICQGLGVSIDFRDEVETPRGGLEFPRRNPGCGQLSP